MHRSSESIASLAAALAKAQVRTRQSREIADRQPSSRQRATTPNGFSATPHSPAGLRSCARPWASMRSPRSRPPRIDQTAGTVNLTTVLAHASGRMDLLRLAGLRHRRYCRAASDGRGADLCPPLCPLHSGRDCRRGRSRRTRPADAHTKGFGAAEAKRKPPRSAS